MVYEGGSGGGVKRKWEETGEASQSLESEGDRSDGHFKRTSSSDRVRVMIGGSATPLQWLSFAIDWSQLATTSGD